MHPQLHPPEHHEIRAESYRAQSVVSIGGVGYSQFGPVPGAPEEEARVGRSVDGRGGQSLILLSKMLETKKRQIESGTQPQPQQLQDIDSDNSSDNSSEGGTPAWLRLRSKTTSSITSEPRRARRISKDLPEEIPAIDDPLGDDPSEDLKEATNTPLSLFGSASTGSAIPPQMKVTRRLASMPGQPRGSDLPKRAHTVMHRPAPAYIPTTKLIQLHMKFTELTQRKEQKIELIKNRIEVMRRETGDDIANLRRWMLLSLVPHSRRIAWARMAEVELLLKLEQRAHWIVEKRSTQLKVMIDEVLKTDSDATEVIVPFAMLAEPPDLCIEDRIFRRGKRLVDVVHRDVEQLSAQYSVLIRRMRAPNHAATKSKLKKIMAKTVCDPSTSWAPVDYNQQGLFERIICDERIIEGRRLSHFFTIIVEDSGAFHPSDVLDFIDQFSETVASDHGLRSELGKLKLFVARTVHPRIHDMTFAYGGASVADLDRAFREKCRYLRVLSAEQLEIAPKFIGSGVPFANAVEAMSMLELLLVPEDMLGALATATRLAHEEAAAAANDGSALAADDLFPILIWVVVQADLWRVHQCIAYMTTFVDDRFHLGEMGYCLASLEAAVQHICFFVRAEHYADEETDTESEGEEKN